MAFHVSRNTTVHVYLRNNMYVNADQYNNLHVPTCTCTIHKESMPLSLKLNRYLLCSECGEFLLLHDLQQSLFHCLPHQHLQNGLHLLVKVEELQAKNVGKVGEKKGGRVRERRERRREWIREG